MGADLTQPDAEMGEGGGGGGGGVRYPGTISNSKMWVPQSGGAVQQRVQAKKLHLKNACALRGNNAGGGGEGNSCTFHTMSTLPPWGIHWPECCGLCTWHVVSNLSAEATDVLD